MNTKKAIFELSVGRRVSVCEPSP